MKIMNHNIGNLKELLKKYLPVTSLILLTLLLMIIFRNKKQDIGRFLEKGKNNLVAFYAQNLQPIFTTTEISNEDVFNFALYQNLPIDKQNNKVLTISNQSNGDHVYEIKPVLYNPKTNNYQKFTEYLGLNSKQKVEADSILNLYKKELYLSVLMNNKNTIAVSSKIGEIQKAVLADLLNFAGKVNYQKAWDIFPIQHGGENAVKNFITSAKEIPQNEFLFITPDTAFKTTCIINSPELNNAVDKKIKFIGKQKDWAANSSANWGFDFRFNDGNHKEKLSDRDHLLQNISINHPDSNSYKVIIPIPEIAFALTGNDSVRIKIDKAAANLRKLSIVLNGKENELDKLTQKKLRRTKNTGNIEFYFQDPTEMIGKTMEMVSNQDFKNWDEFGKKMESFAQSIAESYSDSVIKKNKNALKGSYKIKPKNPGSVKYPGKME